MKSVNKGPVGVMEHRVLLIVVVENGALEIPPSQEHVSTRRLGHVAALVYEIFLAVAHQIGEVILRLRLRKVADPGQ